MYRTGSGKKLKSVNEIPDVLLAFYNRSKAYETPIQIIIGTDSQNFDDTKMVTVVAMVCEGHGGIFVYEISHIHKISDVRRKLHVETGMSLDLATKLVDLLEAEPDTYGEMYVNCNISIHVDAGNSDKGKTKMLIPELVGWIKSCGYEAHVKPESYVASTIADRISK